MDTPKFDSWVPPLSDPKTARYILMKSPYGIFMVEDVDSESQARDICSIWVNRKTNQSHTDGVWQSWREIARFRPAEGRRVARKLGVVRLYDEPHPFELVLKVRRPWPRSPSP